MVACQRQPVHLIGQQHIGPGAQRPDGKRCGPVWGIRSWSAPGGAVRQLVEQCGMQVQGGLIDGYVICVSPRNVKHLTSVETGKAHLVERDGGHVHLRSELRPSKWMRATPASHSVSPAGGQGRHTSTRVKYPHPSSTPSVYIIHGCRLPPCCPLPRPVLQSPSHPPPHTCLLQHVRQQHPPKVAGPMALMSQFSPSTSLTAFISLRRSPTYCTGRGEGGLGCFR